MKKKRWARVPLYLAQLNFLKNSAVFLNFLRVFKTRLRSRKIWMLISSRSVKEISANDSDRNQFMKHIYVKVNEKNKNIRYVVQKLEKMKSILFKMKLFCILYFKEV